MQANPAPFCIRFLDETTLLLCSTAKGHKTEVITVPAHKGPGLSTKPDGLRGVSPD